MSVSHPVNLARTMPEGARTQIIVRGSTAATARGEAICSRGAGLPAAPNRDSVWPGPSGSRVTRLINRWKAPGIGARQRSAAACEYARPKDDDSEQDEGKSGRHWTGDDYAKRPEDQQRGPQIQGQSTELSGEFQVQRLVGRLDRGHRPISNGSSAGRSSIENKPRQSPYRVEFRSTPG